MTPYNRQVGVWFYLCYIVPVGMGKQLKRGVFFLLLFVINSMLIYEKTIKSIHTGTCTINTCIRNDMNVSQVPVHIDVNTFLHIQFDCASVPLNTHMYFFFYIYGLFVLQVAEKYLCKHMYRCRSCNCTCICNTIMIVLGTPPLSEQDIGRVHAK